jgi:hypothetical protein
VVLVNFTSYYIVVVVYVQVDVEVQAVLSGKHMFATCVRKKNTFLQYANNRNLMFQYLLFVVY